MNLDRPFYRELLERTDAVKYIKDTSGSIEQAFDLNRAASEPSMVLSKQVRSIN